MNKEQFFANVKHHARALQVYKEDLASRESLIDAQPVPLDRELDAIWQEAYFHEKEMLKAAIRLSEACLRKLEEK